MKRLLPLVALILYGSAAFGEDPDLVEGARRAIAYWHSLYLHCGNNQDQGGAWYTVTTQGPPPGSIQMIRELRIQFQTVVLSQEQKLNGYEFMAYSNLEPGPFRWWRPSDQAWRDWQVGEIAPSLLLMKKKGLWSQEPRGERKALGSCSEVPPMDDKR
jgi:hypothetical protein